MTLRTFLDVETSGEALWTMVLLAIAFVLWPAVLIVLVFAMGPWGSMERRQVAEIGAKLALVTAMWCAVVLVGAWARGGA